MKLISLNCYFHNLDKKAISTREERFERILTFLHSQQADIICLQECFTFYFCHLRIGSSYKDLLQESFCNYSCFVDKPYKPLLGFLACHQDSGLCTISKNYPSYEVQHSFKTCGWFTRRGFHIVIYPSIWVLNLHLDAFSEAIRFAQIKEIWDICKEANVDWIMIGDFNMATEEERSSTFTFLSNVSNKTLYKTPEIETHQDGCLDFVISTVPIKDHVVFTDMNLSDHFAIGCTLDYSSSK